MDVRSGRVYSYYLDIDFLMREWVSEPLFRSSFPSMLHVFLIHLQDKALAQEFLRRLSATLPEELNETILAEYLLGVCSSTFEFPTPL